MAEERYSLKDDLFNEDTVLKLTNAISSVYDKFDKDCFYEDIINNMSVLELKERITLIREMLEKYLPSDFIITTEILLNSLKTLDESGDFVFASYSEYIEMNGCNEENLTLSLDMLGQYTKWFSAEFAIRRFINTYPEETYMYMLDWSMSKNTEQRRLASEGLRPKLPWASKVNFDYKRGLEPLYNLFFDKERYVVRSVANHLNDISKLDPDLVVEILSTWKKSKKQEEKEMDYLTNHALRTSIKKGHIKSLNLIGYDENPEIKFKNLSIKNKDILIGESLEFSFDIFPLKNEHLMIDFKIKYPMKNDKTSEKVFKLKKLIVEKDNKIEIKKAHPFRIMTTKKLYSGEYTLFIQINGKIYGEESFTLKV